MKLTSIILCGFLYPHLHRKEERKRVKTVEGFLQVAQWSQLQRAAKDGTKVTTNNDCSVLRATRPIEQPPQDMWEMYPWTCGLATFMLP